MRPMGGIFKDDLSIDFVARPKKQPLTSSSTGGTTIPREHIPLEITTPQN